MQSTEQSIERLPSSSVGTQFELNGGKAVHQAYRHPIQSTERLIESTKIICWDAVRAEWRKGRCIERTCHGALRDDVMAKRGRSHQ